ncbi:MAG: hypothetical protein Q7U75_17945, partial [Desulfobacterales bacterium]|nr:hypothetical protein [Desulfobacterales bacterium]
MQEAYRIEAQCAYPPDHFAAARYIPWPRSPLVQKKHIATYFGNNARQMYLKTVAPVVASVLPQFSPQCSPQLRWMHVVRLFLGCLLLFAVAAVSAAVSVTSAATVCPSVTREITTTNLISNSDFSNTATSSIGVGGGVGTATMNTLPANNAISFQSGGTTYTTPNPDVIQAAFPGDSARNIASSNF